MEYLFKVTKEVPNGVAKDEIVAYTELVGKKLQAAGVGYFCDKSGKEVKFDRNKDGEVTGAVLTEEWQSKVKAAQVEFENRKQK